MIHRIIEHQRRMTSIDRDVLGWQPPAHANLGDAGAECADRPAAKSATLTGFCKYVGVCSIAIDSNGVLSAAATAMSLYVCLLIFVRVLFSTPVALFFSFIPLLWANSSAAL